MNHKKNKQQPLLKTQMKRLEIISVLVGLFAIIVFFIYLGINKDIWFCDEVCTYISANVCNYHSIFSESRWLLGTEVTEFLAAGGVEDGRFWEIAENLYTDHVPLYFWIFRVFSLIFKGSATKWIGLSWNLILFIMLYYFLIVFYAQSPNLKHKFTKFYHGISTPRISLILIILAILFHPLVLSEALTIRMYLQFTVLQVVFMCVLDANEMSKKNFIYLLLVTILALLTHFYLWIWLGLLSVIYMIYIFLFQSKKIKKVVYYCGNMLLSLILSTLIFPYWIQNIFLNTNTKGNSSLHKILNFKELPNAVILAVKGMCNYLTMSKVNFCFGLMFFISIFLIYLLSRRYNYKIVVMIISSILYSVFVIYTQPSSEGRYLWSSCILLLIAMVEMIFADLNFLYEIFKFRKNICHPLVPRLIRILSVSIVSVMLLGNIFLSMDFNHISYLQYRSKQEHQAIERSSDMPWLVFHNDIDWIFLCSMYDFQIAKVVKRIDVDAVGQYDEIIENASEMVVYTIDSEKNIEDCIRFINESCNKKNINYEKISKSYAMSVYRIYWK